MNAVERVDYAIKSGRLDVDRLDHETVVAVSNIVREYFAEFGDRLRGNERDVFLLGEEIGAGEIHVMLLHLLREMSE